MSYLKVLTKCTKTSYRTTNKNSIYQVVSVLSKVVALIVVSLFYLGFKTGQKFVTNPTKIFNTKIVSKYNNWWYTCNT